MSKNLKLFKKITCILGITFLVLGMVPLPMVSKITTAAANVNEGKTSVSPKALGLPNLHFTSSKKANGESCNNGNACESGYCSPEGVCADQSQNPVVPTPVDCSGHWGACSVTCGGGTQTFIVDTPAQNGGAECSPAGGTTQSCNTEACAPTCLPNGENCANDGDCCEGNCNGNKCKAVVSQCKGPGGPCGGNTDCCPGLVCFIGAGPENEKCTTPPPTDTNCVGSWSACEGDCGTTGTQTFTITTYATGSGTQCEAENGKTRNCQMPVCNVDCEGEWSPCDGTCGQAGVSTFHISIPASGSGAVCDFVEGATQTCQMDPCPPRCGDGTLNTGEACDDGNASNDDGCSQYCTVEVCGDGVKQSNEGCDDGGTAAGDGCSATCTVEFCGDGAVQPALGENCDDGNSTSGDGCNSSCQPEICGNGVLEANEQCDDGNLAGADGCSANCMIEVCGNGIADPGEVCDDGNVVNTDACTNACGLPACGDGFVQTGEACDDSNTADNDGCSSTCAIEVCGDGIQQANEGCDDSNTANNDGCSQYCTVESCGDDVLQTNEGCDDGNTTSGDGCNAQCVTEFCGDGATQTALQETCDDGNNTSEDGCSATCVVEACGDGVTQDGLGETCDDGDTEDNDGCNAQCATEYCGDEILQTALGEACDDGNEINQDGCSTQCTIETCGDGVLQEAMGEQCDGEVLPVGAPQGAACSDICILEYCDDGITNLDELCDGEAWCTETCNIKDLLSLGIDPYCATKAGVGNILVWEIINPNAFTVPVKWTLDGDSGGPTNLSGGGILFVGNTVDGPSSHTLSASIDLPGGPSSSFSSSRVCGTPPPPGGGGTGTGIIPVTGGAGGPNEPLIIPVTGIELGLNLAAIQKLFMFMGLMLFGVTMMLEGFDRKRTK